MNSWRRCNGRAVTVITASITFFKRSLARRTLVISLSRGIGAILIQCSVDMYGKPCHEFVPCPRLRPSMLLCLYDIPAAPWFQSILYAMPFVECVCQSHLSYVVAPGKASKYVVATISTVLYITASGPHTYCTPKVIRCSTKKSSKHGSRPSLRMHSLYLLVGPKHR